MRYFDIVENKKKQLDHILIQHKAQPVGWGYIDIIVQRDELENTIESISKLGFLIKTVGWWEYITNYDQKPKIGMGGPISIFYPGWFAEINEYDEIEPELHSIILQKYETGLINQSNKKVLERILNKTTKFFGQNSLSYQKDPELTPGIWIEVPDAWINPYTNESTIGFLPEYTKLVEENRKRNIDGATRNSSKKSK